jgi:hypothetical protein
MKGSRTRHVPGYRTSPVVSGEAAAMSFLEHWHT